MSLDEISLRKAYITLNGVSSKLIYLRSLSVNIGTVISSESNIL